LEADVAARSELVLRTGEPMVVAYDARMVNGDVIIESGCNGSIEVLIERLDNADTMDCLQFLESSMRDRRFGAMATVFQVHGGPPVTAGNRLFLSASGEISGSLASADFAPALAEDMLTVMSADRALSKTYRCSNGSADMLLEPVKPPIQLLLCGSGQDTAPIF